MIRLATFNPNSTFARSHSPAHTRPISSGGKRSRELGEGSGRVVGITVRARGVESGILVFVQRDTIFDTQRQVGVGDVMASKGDQAALGSDSLDGFLRG